MELFKIFGTIDIKDGDASKKLSDIDKKGEGVGSSLKSGMKTAGKWGAAIGGAAIGGAAAMMGMAKKSAANTDEIDKMSQKIGISRQGYQELSYVLSQNGTDINVLQRGFKTMNERMAQSIDGTGKGAEAFDKLGLSALDLNGEMKSQEEMFDDAARALMQMPEGAEKSQLAFDLFGKAGQELMPLLNGTEEDLDALTEAAHDMGLVLSDEAVDAGAAFTDTMDNVERSLGAIVTNIGVALMPIIETFLEWVVANMPTIKEVMGSVFDAISGYVQVVVDIFQAVFLPVISMVVDWVTENFPMIQTVIKTVIDLVMDIIVMFVDVVSAVWEVWGDTIISVVKGAFEIVQLVIKVAMDIIRNVIDIVTALIEGDWEGVWNGIKSLFQSVWDGMKSIVTTIINAIKGVIQSVMNVIKGIISSVMGVISNVFSTVWNAIKSTITTVVNGIKNVISTIFNSIKTVISTIMSGIQTAISTVWSAITGIFSGMSSLVGIASGIFESVKTAIMTPINTARDLISTALEKIKGFFSNLKLKFPKIEMPKLPKFSIEGKFSLKPLSVPRLGVTWNKEGAIFTRPTIFDTNQGMQGVGEAGAEAVLPISKLSGIMASTLNKMDSNQGKSVEYGDIIINLNNANIYDNRDIRKIMKEAAVQVKREVVLG